MGGNWIDRLVGYVSPERGLRRARARAGMAAINGVVQTVRRTAASREGTLANFQPSRLNAFSVERDADLIRDRAESLAGSDGLAAACVDTLALNVVGSGMRPQSQPNSRILGLTDDEADAFAESAERAWKIWCREADAADTDHFDDLQYPIVRSMFALGEFVQIPVWIEEPGRHFGLALQTIHPGRLRTPSDMLANPRIRRGVEVGEYGRPVAYWLAEPPDNRSLAGLSSAYFRRVPRKIAHRWGCFHRRHANGPEQPRGETIFAPALKLFSDMSAYIDSELVGAVIAASLTVFIEGGASTLDGGTVGLSGDKKTGLYTPYPKEFEPGTIVTGRTGDKPHLLANPRPGDSFDPFMARLSKLATASMGQPHITVFKDFSETNYSAMRGALLEVGKRYTLEQDWTERGWLQPLWEMVLEEAFLRGMLVMPSGKPDFYAAMDAWCEAAWTHPPRGEIDIVKERTGQKIGLANRTDCHSDILNARGTDTETMARKIARDKRIFERNGVDMPGEVSTAVSSTATNEDDAQTPKEDVA
ncbi:MAG: phage portal protein [Desulfovibrio sp.]